VFSSLESFNPRSEFDLPSPCSAGLLQNFPIGFGDRVGIERAVGFVGGLLPLGATNGAVNHEMSDMNALGASSRAML
jgi:hypothetical protein